MLSEGEPNAESVQGTESERRSVGISEEHGQRRRRRHTGEVRPHRLVRGGKESHMLATAPKEGRGGERHGRRCNRRGEAFLGLEGRRCRRDEDGPVKVMVKILRHFWWYAIQSNSPLPFLPSSWGAVWARPNTDGMLGVNEVSVGLRSIP